MTSQVVGLRVASILFALACLAHVLRLWTKWEVTIGSHHIGSIPSMFAVIVLALLSVWLWSLSLPNAPAEAPKT